MEKKYVIIKLSINGEYGSSLLEQLSGLLSIYPKIIFDMEGINFNSMHLGEMINLYNAFKEIWKNEDSEVILVNVTDFSKEVFLRTKLNQIFHLHNSISDATQSI